MTLRRLGEFHRWLPPWVDIAAFDTETTSLSYMDLDIEGFSIAYDEKSCYVNLVNNPQKLTILAELKLWIENLDFVVMQNAPFDLKVLHKYDIYPKKVFCTMTAAHLLDENGPKGLKDLANRVLKIPKQCIKSYNEVERDTPEFYNYAENDARWTWELYLRQKPELTKQGLDKLFYEVEMPFQHVLKDMNVVGMGYDSKKREEVYYELRHKIFEWEHQLLEMCGMGWEVKLTRKKEIIVESPINYNSSKQVIELVEKRFKLPITERTKKGAKSFGKETKERLKGHPFIDLITIYHRANKLMNTFIADFDQFIDKDDRIRASFNNARAVTGRLTCSNPNLEQLAKNSDICNIRDLFVAAPGNVLVVADYAGQELTVLGEVTQDSKLLETLLKDLDIHLMVANSVFKLGLKGKDFVKNTPANDKACETYKEKRHATKNGIVFPVVYGSTAYGISKYFAIPESEAQGYLDSFLDLYPGVRTSIADTNTELNRYEYVIDMFGRRRRFPGYRNMWKGHKARAERQAFNFKIQSPSATMCRQAANRIHADGYDIVNLVHDEVIVEVPECYAEGAVADIRELMTTDTGLNLPIGVSIKYAKSYGSAK